VHFVGLFLSSLLKMHGPKNKIILLLLLYDVYGISDYNNVERSDRWKRVNWSTRPLRQGCPTSTHRRAT